MPHCDRDKTLFNLLIGIQWLSVLFKRRTWAGPWWRVPFVGMEGENGCVFVAVLMTHRGLDGGKSMLWAAGRKFCISKENSQCECVLLVPCLLSFEESGIISRIYSCKWTAVQCPFQPSRTRKLETTAYGCVRLPEPAFPSVFPISLIPLIWPVLVSTIFVIRYCLCVSSHLKQP